MPFWVSLGTLAFSIKKILMTKVAESGVNLIKKSKQTKVKNGWGWKLRPPKTGLIIQQ